jgi:glucose/arabinose dehydrogenase
MQKKLILVTAVLGLALALTACGGGSSPAQPEAQQPAPQQATTQQPAAPTQPAEEAAEASEPPAAEAAEQPAVDSDDPETVIKAVMEGVTTDVKIFLEGIPVPENGTVQLQSDDKVEFLTQDDVATAAEYYRQTFTSLGLIEIGQLTEITESFGTMYFGGYPDGRAIKIKFRRITPSSTEVKVHFQDL